MTGTTVNYRPLNTGAADGDYCIRMEYISQESAVLCTLVIWRSTVNEGND